jgi:uncharacterized protein YggE
MRCLVLVFLLLVAAAGGRRHLPVTVPDILSTVGDTDDFEPSHPAPPEKPVAPTTTEHDTVVATTRKKATLRTRGKTTRKTTRAQTTTTTEEETTRAPATTKETTQAPVTTTEETTRVTKERTTEARVLTAAPAMPRPVQEAAATASSLTKIVVVGYGSAVRKPNQMTLRVSVSTEGGATTRDTRETHTKNCMGVRSVLHSFFTKHANPDDKIAHESMSLTPRYDFTPMSNRRVFKGYSAVTNFVIRIDEIPENGKLVDDLTQAGALIDSVSMGVKEPDMRLAMDEARRLAISHALTTANVEALAANLEVVSVVSITSGGGGGGNSFPAPRMMQMAAMDVPAESPSSDAVDPGVLTFSASVTVELAARAKEQQQ